MERTGNPRDSVFPALTGEKLMLDCSKHGETEHTMTGMIVQSPMCDLCVEEFRKEFNDFMKRCPHGKNCLECETEEQAR